MKVHRMPCAVLTSRNCQVETDTEHDQLQEDKNTSREPHFLTECGTLRAVENVPGSSEELTRWEKAA